MRKLLLNFLIEQAKNDPDLFLIVGDLGFSLIEEFREKYPKQFINAGVAEQNMIGMAAGMAMAGKRVYVYSIVPFACMRNFEQIRLDLCYQELPVTVIGNGGGYSYGQAGVTHHALEDVAIMRTLPGMTVVAPGCLEEAVKLFPEVHQHKGPVYLRLSKTEEVLTYPSAPLPKIGKALEIIQHRPEHDVLLAASGNALDLAWEVAQELEKKNIRTGLVSVPTVKPLDDDYFLSQESNIKALFTLEEHSIIGGLGEAVARLLSEEFTHKVAFHAFGVQDFYTHKVGSRAYLKTCAQLTARDICEKICSKLASTGVKHRSTTFEQAQL